MTSYNPGAKVVLSAILNRLPAFNVPVTNRKKNEPFNLITSNKLSRSIINSLLNKNSSEGIKRSFIQPS